MTEFWTTILVPALVNGTIGSFGAMIALLIYNIFRVYH